MIKVLGGGGLGDAVMTYSKLSKLDVSIGDIELTHIEVHDTLLPKIKEFYTSQNVNSIIIQTTSNRKWRDLNEKNYNIYLDSSAYGSGVNSSIEINPFPKFEITNNYDFDVVLSPSSGRIYSRFFGYNNIVRFISENSNKKIALVGVENNSDKYDDLPVTNLINKTTIAESIDIIASSKYVIAPTGFVSFIGCMSKKNVFTKHDDNVIEENYYHKFWNNKFINGLNEISL